MAPALIGIDIGTSVIKSTLFDLDGSELAVSSREAVLLHPRQGWVEMEMDAVWSAVVETLRAVAKTAAPRGLEIAAIGVTGQGDGTWLVGADGRPVRPAITWLDGRVGEMVTAAHESGLSEKIFAITGTALNTANQGLHLRWLQEHEPESLRRSAAALRAKDWVFLHLTGEISTDETDASHTYFDAATRTFAPQILELLAISTWKRLIPAARPPHENKAPLLDAVAADIGLPPGVPVVGGPFDVSAADVGSGILQPGDACTILGTAGIHQIVIDSPVPEPHNVGYTMAHAPANRLVRLLPTMTGTLNLQWFIREFFAHEVEEATATGKSIWNVTEELAAAVAIGCDGVMYHPYIDAAGERSPFVRPDARAQFTGMSAHHTRQVLLRAVYEGVVLSAMDCYAHLGLVRVLRLTGGGARSALWAQMFADALGCPVQTVQGSEQGARGAAITAGIAVGLFSSYEQGVDAMVRLGRAYEPDLLAGSQYRELLQIYRHTYEAMSPVWAERAEWRRNHPWKAAAA